MPDVRLRRLLDTNVLELGMSINLGNDRIFANFLSKNIFYCDFRENKFLTKKALIRQFVNCSIHLYIQKLENKYITPEGGKVK